MTAPVPAFFAWDGEAMRPTTPFMARLCDRQFTIGERYRLAIHEERSTATHNHQFAEIAEAWANLPEDMAQRFPTPEHLRKYALVRTGYADSHTIVCSSRAEALRFAAFLRPIDEFAVVEVNGTTVTRWTAKSQSRRAMDKATFQASKQACLEFVANLIGVSAGELSAHAKEAA